MPTIAGVYARTVTGGRNFSGIEISSKTAASWLVLPTQLIEAVQIFDFLNIRILNSLEEFNCAYG